MEKYLYETASTILNQTYRDFELICVDDGSTDSSPELLKKLQESDSRVRVITQPNQGPGASRNTGLDSASGDYVMMLDADDLYSPTMLEQLVGKSKETESEIVVCGSEQFEDGTNLPVESWWTLNLAQVPEQETFSPLDMPDFVFNAFIGWPWDKLYKRSFIEKYNIRYPKLTNSEDLYFVFLSLALAKKISIIEDTLIKHRVGRTGSVSGSRAKAPLDFYRSTCLLKNRLKENKELYAALSWGFLNWAFGYMVWNIETMTDKNARMTQLQSLKNGGFSELEIGLHSPAFFSLDPSAYGRYINLLSEAYNLTESEKVRRQGKILPRLIKLLTKIQYDGFIDTMKFSLGWLKRKLLRKSADNQKLHMKRGSDFALIAPELKKPNKDKEH